MYRLKVGDKYCSLNTNLHVDGVAIPDSPSREAAHVCEHVNTANAIIRRTNDLKGEIRGSMFAEWPKFKPVLFEGGVEHEEFLVEESE